MGDESSTRERLLAAGMTLFAERGFQATRVGDIEAAVGLQPRRGALYNHFASKEALLEEGARRAAEAVSTGVRQIEGLTISPVGPGDVDGLRLVIHQLGLWTLGSVDQQRRLTQLLEHDGDRLPSVRELLRHDVVDAGARAASRLLASAVPDLEDPDAAAALLVNALVGHRRATWTFGGPPLGVSDRRLVAQWVDIVLALVAATLPPAPPSARRRRPRRGT